MDLGDGGVVVVAVVVVVVVLVVAVAVAVAVVVVVVADDVFTAPWNWHVFTTHVQSATEWTASVHTLHMSKPVM